MNVKQIVKLLIVNISISLILLASLEFILFNMSKLTSYIPDPNIQYWSKINIFNYEKEKKNMRKPEGIQYKKAPILVFGCSFAYGHGLNNNQTFSHKLSELTKRPVYNRGVNGWGMQHILYQFKRPDFYKEVKEPEYIIYVAIPDHYNRLFRYQFSPRCNCNFIFLRYKYSKNNFKEIHPFLPTFWNLYIVKYAQQFIEEQIIESEFNKKNNYEFLYKIMHESMKYKKIHFPKSKFIILMYNNNQKSFIDDLNLRTRLEKDGFIIIEIKNLTPKDFLINKEYKANDSLHPSKKAWDIVTPKLAKKLNL